MKRFLNTTNALFIILLVLAILPSKRAIEGSWYLTGLILAVELYYIVSTLTGKDSEKAQTTQDITAIVFSFMIVWELLTTKLGILDKMLFPSAGAVISLFVEELPELLKGLASSLELLAGGYTLALITAIPLALVIGWRRRLFKAVNPITKVLGPIPPIVYIPYAIALLPTFKISSIFIIFIGAFWPIFINTLNGVFNMEKRIIDSAKALNVKERTMLFEIILPGSLPSILSGATVGLVMSFILLTAAEMIGATSGLGWYVKYFSDFADYTRVIVGIIFIGIVVTVITHLFDRLEKYLLRWRK